MSVSHELLIKRLATERSFRKQMVAELAAERRHVSLKDLGAWRQRSQQPACTAPGALGRVLPLSNSDLEQWQQLVTPLAPVKPFIVNIGAGDGVGLGDPCAYWLTKPDAIGLAVDGPNLRLKQKLAANYPSAGVVKHWTFVSPDDIGAVLARGNTPREPFVFKIDIDCFDADITGKVLELGYRPKFIYVEHAYNFPPGFWFKVRYSARHSWWWSSRDHVFGNSASVWYDLLVGTSADREYVLLGVSGNNMLFGHVSVVQLPSFMSNPKRVNKVLGGWQPSLQCTFEEGFLNKSAWYGKHALNVNGVSWWTHDEISPEKRLRGMMDHVRAAAMDSIPLSSQL